jgi:glycosyltransferase involved in cell wall biosynthesis
VLDEAEALPGVLWRMPAGFEPIVVDNGSTDGSGEVARSLGARVVVESRRGFGAACYAGLCAAHSQLVCFMDCDGSLDPRELSLVCEPVADRDLDLCLGARTLTPGAAAGAGASAWPWHARLANRALARELRRRTDARLTDLGPMRACRREALVGLGLRDRAFGWPLEMVLRAGTAGWRIGEVPVAYGPRVGGRSKVSGSVRGTARAVRDLGALLR